MLAASPDIEESTKAVVAQRKHLFWGEWIRQEGIIKICALVNTDDKENVLKTFLEENVDVDKYYNQRWSIFFNNLCGISAFIQEQEEKVYSLKPDTLCLKIVGCSK